MAVKYRDGKWWDRDVQVTPEYVSTLLEETAELLNQVRVKDLVVALWKEGDLDLEDVVANQMARIGELRTELDRVTQERDWQYEENVNRIAAQGAAESDAYMWEWVARRYALHRKFYPFMLSIDDMLKEFAEEHPCG